MMLQFLRQANLQAIVHPPEKTALTIAPKIRVLIL